MNRLTLTLMALLALFTATALRAQNTTSATPVRALVSQDKYTIVRGDLIEVKVFQEEDLESTLRVAEDGNVVVPLVGPVTVANLTPAQAAKAIADALKKGGYLKNPQVTVTVVEAYKYRFTILGEVQKPGSYDLPTKDKLTLLEAIGMASGYTALADPSKITIKRTEADGKGEGEEIFRLNAKKLASGKVSGDFEVRPGDVITVGERWW